jgi:hypothetical protein
VHLQAHKQQQQQQQQQAAAAAACALTSLHDLTGSLLHCCTSLVTSLHSTLLLVLGTSSQVTSSQLCAWQQQQQQQVEKCIEQGLIARNRQQVFCDAPTWCTACCTLLFVQQGSFRLKRQNAASSSFKEHIFAQPDILVLAGDLVQVSSAGWLLCMLVYAASQRSPAAPASINKQSYTRVS